MSQTSVYLNKQEISKIRKITQKLGVSDYKIIALLIDVFLDDPAFLLLDIKAKLKSEQ